MTTIRARLAVPALALGVWLAACSHKAASNGETAAADSGGAPGAEKSKGDSAAGDSASQGATPVTMARVERATLAVLVSAPGVTDAVEDERVRAPFKGRLVSLTVNLGDQVREGQVIGDIVAQESEAALQGARAMLRTANEPGEKQDAERAMALAQKNLVRTPLHAPKSGVVIARPASPGELVADGDSIVSIAATGSMVFFAEVSQGDLGRVKPGQHAVIQLTARQAPIAGVVRSVLPADTGSSVSMRVRLDLQPRNMPVTVGLFGTARITVAQHANTIIVPRSALLRDDVSGTTQVAVVGADNHAHWVQVTTGITDSLRAEILSPALPVGQRVITTGQVGLPDSARVVAAKPGAS